MKNIIIISLCMILWSTEALAFRLFTGCSTASITSSTPTVDFVDHGNGTVTHIKTGLMWKQCSEGLSGIGCATGAAAVYTWQGALQAAQTLNAAGGFVGFTDWRVPNIKELNSIVENQCFNPSINTTVFPATMIQGYWSSTPNSTFASGALTHDDSNPNAGDNKSFNHYVRLVRGGQ